MCYILYMNKDVIYIEPEDDITDIITKIENSKEKIVALVPPKKAGVLRSVVNIKLIAKAATSAKKKAVLVTTDPSIVKLAAATKLPVTKDLQSAPSVPDVDVEAEKAEKEDLVEEKEDEEAEEERKDGEEEKEEEEEEDEDEEKEEEDKGKEKGNASKPVKKKKSGNNLFAFFAEHKKLSIICGILGLILILVLIWALFIAPAVDVFVSIKTDTNNFSESVSFVKDQKEENIKEGKIYLEERKIESTEEVKFTATGQKNIGERAKGDLVVYSYFKVSGSVPINAGTAFSISGLTYYADEDVSISYKDDGNDVCDNSNNIASLIRSGCLVSARVKVTASAPGTKYNIQASNSGWSAVAHVDGVYSDKAMTGGTDQFITVVQQADVEKARNELNTGKESESKEKLYASINKEDNIIIESTFKQDTSAAVSTPAVDEEVKEGIEPTLKATTTTLVYTIDKTKLEEFIREKIELPESKKIFEIRNVYIDGFKEIDSGFIGKLKAAYFTGPKITESELVEKIMGKGIGDARREIKDIEGVADVKMEPSYPWVMKVPTDSNRISMTFEIKDQEGNEIKEKTDEKSEEKEDEEADEKSDDSKEE